MGQSKPFRATALVVEDDAMQREMICVLLEESEYDVIQCESAEAAELVLDRMGSTLSLLMTDVNLAGRMSGAELAAIAHQRHPALDVVVTSGKPLNGRCPTASSSGPSHGPRSTCCARRSWRRRRGRRRIEKRGAGSRQRSISAASDSAGARDSLRACRCRSCSPR